MLAFNKLYYHQSQSAAEADKDSVISFKGIVIKSWTRGNFDPLVALCKKSGDHQNPQDSAFHLLMSVPNFTAIHPVDVEIFQSGPTEE